MPVTAMSVTEAAVVAVAVKLVAVGEAFAPVEKPVVHAPLKTPLPPVYAAWIVLNVSAEVMLANAAAVSAAEAPEVPAVNVKPFTVIA